MVQSSKIVDCVIAEYPLVQMSAVHGLKELADTANRLAPTSMPKLNVTTCLLSSRTPRHKSDFGVVVLPPCLSHTPPSLQNFKLALDWINRCHFKGSLICSVCSGSFILAETGLLDGRSATTHWLYASSFQDKFPQIELQFDRLIDHHGDVMTAGGLMAWTDLGLQLIEHFQGTQTMLEVSRLFLLEPKLRQQKQYALFVPKHNHGDEKILAVQRLIEKQFARRWSITDMAHKAGLTDRTFLRRFKRSTELNPTQYLQQIRVAAARTKLETSTHSVEQVALLVGYTDTPAFARIFKRIVGLPPGVYRKRFN